MFDEHFEAVLADTEEARRIHFGIRYQVYCQETGFEDPEAFPDGLERDEWDAFSVHFMVRLRKTGEWIAAMRLVLPSAPDFPVERECILKGREVRTLPRNTTAEVSRLCMVSRFRRRGPEQDHPYELGDLPIRGLAGVRRGHERRREPEILLGLLRAARGYSRKEGIDHWYLLVTPPLTRILRRVGIHLDRVGPLCLHRGKRYPFLADLQREEKRLGDTSCRITNVLGREPPYLRFSEL